MTDAEIALLGAAALVVGFVVIQSRKANTHQGAATPAASTGVLGANPVLNPAAPKTTGDFARYDRTTSSTVTDTGSVHYHDPVYDAPAPAQDVPAVDPSYIDDRYIGAGA